MSKQERLRAAAKGAVESVLEPSTAYEHTLVPQWAAEINRRVLETLRGGDEAEQKQQQGERFVANCVVLQKSREPFYMATAAYWNDATDCCVSYRWTNATVVCVVTVIAVTATTTKRRTKRDS